MSTILGNPITLGGGGASLNIDFGTTPPSDTSKLWVPLAKKPSAVECSPVLNYGSEIYSGVVGSLKTYTNNQPSCCYLNGKIYAIVRPTSDNYFLNVIDANTMSVEASYTPPQFLNNVYVSTFNDAYPQLIAYGGYVFVVAGYKIYKKDVTNDTTIVLATIGNNGSMRCIEVVDGKLYVIGGWLKGYENFFNTIQEIDLETGSYTSWSATLSRGLGSAGSIAFGKYIYFLGGAYNTSSSSNTIFKLDTVNKTVSTITATLPVSNTHFAYAAVGSKLYMFGGATSWSAWNQNNYNRDSMVCFDAATETVTTLSQNLDIKLKNACACSDGNGNIYICGGYGTSSNAQQIRKFVATTPLTSNHLLLQEDFGTDGLWSALKSKDTDLKVKVINAYLGDSNNIAQLTDAYLYDSDSATWKSLDGVSMTADMLAALATLGVT